MKERFIRLYSKIHQEKYAYKLEIDIKHTRCPVCGGFKLHMSQSGLITCRCGFISDIKHNYVAGVHLNNDLDFKINKVKKENEEDTEK